MIEAHMFWAYGNPGQLELLCVNSFLAQGYRLNFWSYDQISNLPPGARLRDARDVLPEERCFHKQNGLLCQFL